MRFASVPLGLVPLLACLTAGSALACDVKSLKLEELIATKKEFRESANAQTVHDLRTLRDAAVILEARKFPAECERLIAIVKSLAGDPDRAIEQSGDTDEEKAEAIEETREPKAKTAK